MRLKAFALALSLSLSLCACNETEQVKLESPYSCEVTISTDADTYSGALKRDEGKWTFTYSEPEEIAGLTICYEGDEYNVKLGDIEFSDDRESLPDSAISTLIISSLDSATLSSDVKYTANNDTVVAKGVVGESAYTITFKDDIPKSLSVEGIEVKFSDFKSEE
ncbi:MAG: hypothetical protein LIO41_07380 [Ruminococcus sp.]|nr:hypothetical protein [Ruminococcus sp.]